MEQPFEAVLTGTDTPVEGTVTQTSHNGFNQAYQFISVDDTLHLTVAKDQDNQWIRVAGTDPYLSGWVDELAEQIKAQSNTF